MKRKDESIDLISLVGNETLLGVSSVTKSDSVMIFHKNGEPEIVMIKDIEIGSRISKGDKIAKTTRGDSIVGFKIFQ